MTAVVETVAPGAVAAPAMPRPRPGEYGVLAAVLGLLLGALPAAGAFYWSPKAAVALVMIGPGMVALVVAALGRDRAAVAGLAFLAVAGLATALSPSPLLAVTGLYNDGTGLLFLGAVVGAWALGRRLGPVSQDLLVYVLLGAALVNAVMVWLQMSSFFTSDLFSLVDDRGLGLLGNPVHATAFLVGAVALTVERIPHRAGAQPAAAPAREPIGPLGLALLIAVFASAVQLTGGRIGIVLLVLVAVRAFARTGLRRGAIVVAALALGIGCAAAVFPSGTGAAGRLADSGSSTFGGRVDRWRTAVPAVGDRPVLGIGPGLYRRATSVHDTVAAATAFGADSLYRDAHDVFVETVVTTGILGLGALVLWLLLAALGARGSLAWFAGFAGVSLLFQPSFVGLTPVVALALGAAAARRARPFGAAGVSVALVLALVGGAFGGLLVRGDVVLGRAARGVDTASARRAVQLLPLWPEPTYALMRAEVSDAHRTGDAVHWRRAIGAARAAIRRDPSEPGSWNALGELELAHGGLGASERAFTTALRWNPYSVAGLAGLATVAHTRHDDVRVRQLCRTLHEVAPSLTCPGRRRR